jgi:hypothetical protein
MDDWIGKKCRQRKLLSWRQQLETLSVLSPHRQRTNDNDKPHKPFHGVSSVGTLELRLFERLFSKQVGHL